MATKRVSNTSKKSISRKQAKKKRKRIFLFLFEVIVLAVLLVVLYGVLKADKVEKIAINEDNIVINDQVESNQTMKGYRNVALFGVDARNGALGKGTRSDTIMIASLNMDTGDVKLVSVYRDTYLNLGNDTYNKCNAAYAKGGPEQAINMLNMNMDLNITDYVTVGFQGLIDTIDALGGVEIEVDEAELPHLNNYQITIAEDLNRSYTPVTTTGKQLLNGMQATAYCRIRYTKGDDFKRAERQREVLMATMEVAKKASPATLNKILDDVLENVSTSLDVDEMVEMLGSLSKYNMAGNDGFPFESNRQTGTIGSKGSCVIPVSLADNVTLLHSFLFGAEDYQMSSEVQSYSDKVASDTSSYIN